VKFIQLEVIFMTKYREILRLHSQGISSRNIAASCECSRNTVAKVLTRAEELAVSWPLPERTTDGDLERQFFPKSASSSRRLPDREFLHKEPRHKRSSTIFCSQFAPAGWHGKIGELTLADAILDRIVHDSYQITIESSGSDFSMRELYGINQKV
jgi:hypothetical protein